MILSRLGYGLGHYVKVKLISWLDFIKCDTFTTGLWTRTLCHSKFNQLIRFYKIWYFHDWAMGFNRLTPNDPYMGSTAPRTSKLCILYVYSTKLGTEYFKHALYSPFFFSTKCSLFHNANLFGSCIIHILYTECAKIKKIIPASKG